MNPAKLKELVISPENVEEKDFPELLALLSKYPYFQAASILAAKAKNSSEFIKSAAVRTANRSVLRQIISGEFDQDVSLHNIDELDIHSGINAFEKLAKEEDEATAETLVSNIEEESFLDQPAIETDSIEEIENKDESVEFGFQEEAALTEEVEDTVSEIKVEEETIVDDLNAIIEPSFEEELETVIENNEDTISLKEEENVEDLINEEKKDKDVPDFNEADFDSEEELSSMSFEAPNYQFDLDSDSSTTSLEDEKEEKETIINEEEVEENHFDPEVDLPIEEESISPSADDLEKELDDSISDLGTEIEADQSETFVVDDILSEPDIDAEVKDLIEDDTFRNDLMDSLNDLQNTRKALADEENEQKQKIEEENELVESKIEEPELKSEDLVSKNEEPSIETVEPENSEINDEVLDSEYKEIFKNSTPQTEPENIEEDLPKNETFSSENLTEEVVESEEENDTFADADLFDLNYLLGVDEESGKEKKKMRIETTERQKEIIDKFIEEVPQISIQGSDERTQSELAKELYNRSVSEDLSIMTERMAILFSQQGKNGKAIEIYEQLILKYPEKKTYFATLIENLRNEQ